MKTMTTEQACDYLDAASIEQTINLGHCVVNHGVSEAGARFTLIHDFHGCACLTEAL
ncbi:hypothetical protein [Denitromonas halophila]|uniref:hypothetical protein n=1 Tax=Denitromonas halophila TaxID=1629404 RepID=UPI001642479D|nr:hypothetical protein [Denitromonas halophila]